MSARTKLSEYDEEEFFGLALDLDTCRLLYPVDLNHLVHYMASVYGYTNDPLLIEVLMPLYHVYLERVPMDGRHHNLIALREKVEHRQISVNALLPFLCEDPEPTIVASAAIGLALGCEVEDDPIGGPREVVAMVARPGQMNNRAAAAAAMLALGDRQVCDLVWEIREIFTPDELALMAAPIADKYHAPAVEFWLNWALELVDDPVHGKDTFGVVLAALINMAVRNWPPRVVEVETTLPYRPEGESERELRSWSLSEYFAEIRPRMEELAEREQWPKMTLEVIRVWSEAARGEAHVRLPERDVTMSVICAPDEYENLGIYELERLLLSAFESLHRWGPEALPMINRAYRFYLGIASPIGRLAFSENVTSKIRTGVIPEIALTIVRRADDNSAPFRA